MRVYGTPVGSLACIPIDMEFGRVLVMNEAGEVLKLTDTKYSGHSLGGFNVMAGEGILLVYPMAANALVIRPERPGGVYLGAKT